MNKREEGYEMFRKFLLVLLAVILLAGITWFSGCGGDGGSPSGVVKSFYQAINDGDFDKAKSYTIPSLIAPAIPKEFEGNIEKVEIVNESTEKAFGIKVASLEIIISVSPAVYSTSFLWQPENRRFVSLEETDKGWRISTIN
ncbi:MAG: hypothetical protein JXB42_13540 [Deltaproteobacteria bacterium]|nr:hypothetical protein [Deltaproteobacteria bacterium]